MSKDIWKRNEAQRPNNLQDMQINVPFPMESNHLGY
jgi:hypothetical protein